MPTSTHPSRGGAMSSRPLLDHGRMLELLGVEGRLLMTAVHEASPDARVAGASGATVVETVRHAGDSCENALSWLGRSGSGNGRRARPSVAGRDEVEGRFTARLAELLAEFGTRAAHERCRTWWPEDPSVGFWMRRVLHAMTVYRVDVQVAAGAKVTPVEPGPARDGIDEALRLWFGHRLSTLGITAPRAWSVEIVAADRRWVASADSGGAAAVRDGADHPERVDSVVTGDASGVYLWLWGRLPDRAVESSGDPDAIAQLWSLLRVATQ